MNWTRGRYEITDDPARADLDAACALLWSTYWAKSRPREVIERSIRGSLAFSVLHDGVQIGIARVVTDRATVGYLCDVILAPEHRGTGVGKWLLETILGHPELAGCRVDLFTRDAQEFYQRYGFGAHPFTSMVRWPGGGAGPYAAGQ